MECRLVGQAVVIGSGLHSGCPETRPLLPFRSIDTGQPDFFSMGGRTSIPVVTRLKSHQRHVLNTHMFRKTMSQHKKKDGRRNVVHGTILAKTLAQLKSLSSTSQEETTDRAKAISTDGLNIEWST